MLISCTSCHSKYLINSADLKPDGRTVKCAKCGNQWYQEDEITKEEQIQKPFSTFNLPEKNKENKSNLPTPNLPSTYVHENEVSILNSIIAVILLFILVSGFFLLKNLEINSFVLIKYYINEFYFNLMLIIKDIAKVIHQIIN